MSFTAAGPSQKVTSSILSPSPAQQSTDISVFQYSFIDTNVNQLLFNARQHYSPSSHMQVPSSLNGTTFNGCHSNPSSLQSMTAAVRQVL
jgi:hypothetical protein